MTSTTLSWVMAVCITIIACLGHALLIELLAKTEKKALHNVKDPARIIVSIPMVAAPVMVYWYLFWFKALPLLRECLALF